MEDYKELGIESDVFQDAREKFNQVLQRLFKSMTETGSTEGKITLNLDVSMSVEEIPNFDPRIEGEKRKCSKPDFNYKVSSAIQVKDEQKGSNNPQMELIWDDDLKMYVLRPVANTDQRSIFDADFRDVTPEEADPEDQKLIPGTAGFLPPPVSDDGSEDEYGYDEDPGEDDQ